MVAIQQSSRTQLNWTWWVSFGGGKAKPKGDSQNSSGLLGEPVIELVIISLVVDMKVAQMLVDKPRAPLLAQEGQLWRIRTTRGSTDQERIFQQFTCMKYYHCSLVVQYKNLQWTMNNLFYLKINWRNSTQLPSKLNVILKKLDLANQPRYHPQSQHSLQITTSQVIRKKFKHLPAFYFVEQ